MRFDILRTIYFKEVREALRDRRTLFMMVGLPLLLYPALMMLMARLQESQDESQKARVSEVAVWGVLPKEVEQRLTAKGRIRLHPWDHVPAEVRRDLESGALQPPPTPPMQLEAEDEDTPVRKEEDTAVIKAARQVILARQADAVLVAWPGLAAEIDQGGLGVVSILFDSVRPDSDKARDRVNDELRLYRADQQTEREKARGLAKGFSTVIDLQRNNIAPPTRRSGQLLGMVLPYMLILFSAMSGFYAAIDMTAGEKERGTMQTLLCAPLESIEIVTGKFAAVWTISIIATLVNLASLAGTFSRLKMPGVKVSVSVATYLSAFPLLLPITLMVTAVFIAVGAFAKDFKEGQNFLTPVLMSLLFPLMITMTPGIELNGYLAFVPVINIALLIKGVFLGEWHADTAFLVVVSSITYAILALSFAATVFERNNLLLGGKETIAGLFDFRKRPGSRPTPGISVFAFALVLVVLFYGSMGLESRGSVTLLLVSEFGLILLPALALAYLKGFSFRDTFALRAPDWRGVAGAVLIGISAWTFATGVLVRLLPPPESLVKVLEKVLLIHDDATPVWLLLLLVALTPAVCEEALFRGLIMTGFRRMGMWSAVGATALLFGLMHASIYRLAPVVFLGALFGYAVWRTRSLAVGIIGHALNNGLMVMVARYRPLEHLLGSASGVYPPWLTVAGGTALVIAGLALIHAVPREEEETLEAPREAAAQTA